MNRRGFVSTAICAGGLWALRAHAQKVARISYLSVATADLDAQWLSSFRDELKRLGYVEGMNLVFDERRAHGHPDKLAWLAAELVARKPDVLVVYGAWHIADKLRGDTPVVFTVVPDPVAQKIVPSLARPGGNMTGFSDAHDELVPKRLQLIKEIAPAINRVALFYFPSPLALLQVKTAQAAAPTQGITVIPVPISGPQPAEIDRAMNVIVSERAAAILVIAEPTTAANRQRIANAAVRHGLVAASTVREFADAGFLFAYGANFNDLWRRAAVYADKIVKGARPGELPVERPTKFDLILNLKTANAIGLTMPRSLLLRADHVIE
jgi:putative ABC transport system substrate-binding protein